MLYKEWRITRLKLVIWAIIYLGATALFLQGHSQRPTYDEPFFQSWLGISALVMTAVAALGGVDIVSEEKASGTLGFLLTKPISRTQIYFAKIWVNILALAVAFVPFNLFLLGLDQAIPTPVRVAEFVTESCGENTWCSGWQERGTVYRSFDLFQGLGMLGMIFLYGAGIICLSGLISIFARNTIQAIMLTIPALIAFLVIVTSSITVSLGSGLPGSPIVGSTWSFTTLNLSTPLILGGAIIVFFYTGLLAFRRKEF
jgi:ABC-type transport system involved in multi-copper enzyme maturation permease subunit